MSAKMLQPVRGTHDILPEEAAKRRLLVEIARRIAETYGYGEIATPIFEFTDVFTRTLGDTSDIVSKEMYSFTDRGGEQITLRPEFTAGIIRALFSNGLQQQLPLRFITSGPVFRYERPQKGRLRQFHQIDAEIIGIADPGADVEVIALAAHFLGALGLRDKVTLELNSLGDHESRTAYRTALVAYFRDHHAALSADSKERLERNPLRILDSKDEGDRKVIAGAPDLYDCFNTASQDFFCRVKEGLEVLGVAYRVNPRLVRGLDYYSHTVFEFTTTQLGAQGTVLAGGRYDGLAEMMGGSPVPAIGWGAGIERLMALSELNVPKLRPVSIIPLGEGMDHHAFILAQQLRQAGIVTDYGHGISTKKRFQQATKLNARYALILGEAEWENELVALKNLDTGEQATIALNTLEDALLTGAERF